MLASTSATTGASTAYSTSLRLVLGSRLVRPIALGLNPNTRLHI